MFLPSYRLCPVEPKELASTIQQELAMIILSELNDPRLVGMPSITRVRVSEDLSVADVFVTVMGTPASRPPRSMP